MPGRLPALIALAAAGALPAEITYQFDYTGSAEFNDPTLGAARRAALEEAAEWFGASFANDATLQVEVLSFNDPDSFFLASAGSFATPVGLSFTGFIGQIAERKVTTGIDGNGTDPDGCIDINFGVDWDFDDTVDPSSFDFKSTIIHELMHVMGFQSSIFEDGTDIYNTPPGQPGVWVPFDRFVTDAAGTPVIEASFALDSTAWNTHSVGGASPAAGLFFSGPRALAANGGAPVGLYSPSSWINGSSGSHLDDDNPALDGRLMVSELAPGPSTRQLSAIEIAILEDIGFAMKGFRIEIAPQGSDVGLTVHAPPGTWSVTESSGLAGWVSVGSVTIAPPATTAPLVLPAPLGSRFYRVGDPTAMAPPAAPPSRSGPPLRRR